ncbi:MAG: hypothetical protein AAGI89_00305 [Pseudomonadota bacterium]
MTSSSLASLALDRSNECFCEVANLRGRLSTFQRFNWITVMLPSLLAFLASADIFINDGTTAQWAPWLSLAAGALVLVHKTLNCEAHQAEIVRVRKELRRLGVSYRTQGEVPRETLEADLMELDAALATLVSSTQLHLPVLSPTKPGK